MEKDIFMGERLSSISTFNLGLTTSAEVKLEQGQFVKRCFIGPKMLSSKKIPLIGNSILYHLSRHPICLRIKVLDTRKNYMCTRSNLVTK